jgi:hypothetical protein
VRGQLLDGLAAIEGISFPVPPPELQIVTYAGDDGVRDGGRLSRIPQ